MKKWLSAALALCWFLVFLPVAAIPTQAEEDDPEKALQRVYYFDMRTEELLEESTTGVLVKNGSSNLVITVFPSKEDQEIYTIFTTENDDVDFCLFSQFGFCADVPCFCLRPCILEYGRSTPGNSVRNYADTAVVQCPMDYPKGAFGGLDGRKGESKPGERKRHFPY